MSGADAVPPLPSARVAREARITFPPEDVGNAVEFALKLQELREANPACVVEGLVLPTDLLAKRPHKPRLTEERLQDKVRAKARQKAIATYIAEAELDAAARVKEEADNAVRDDNTLNPSSARSSSDGEVVLEGARPKHVVVGHHVVIQVPPHINQRGRVSEVTSQHCFKVTLPDGGSWWCSSDEVSISAQPVTTSSAVPLSTLHEVQMLRRQNNLLARALAQCPSEQYSSALAEEESAELAEVLRQYTR